MREEPQSLCEVYAEAYDKAFWGKRGRALDHEIALEAVAAHVRMETKADEFRRLHGQGEPYRDDWGTENFAKTVKAAS